MYNLNLFLSTHIYWRWLGSMLALFIKEMEIRSENHNCNLYDIVYYVQYIYAFISSMLCRFSVVCLNVDVIKLANRKHQFVQHRYLYVRKCVKHNCSTLIFFYWNVVSRHEEWNSIFFYTNYVFSLRMATNYETLTWITVRACVTVQSGRSAHSDGCHFDWLLHRLSFIDFPT